jgi:hypothetical protein
LEPSGIEAQERRLAAGFEPPSARELSFGRNPSILRQRKADIMSALQQPGDVRQKAHN